MNFLSRMDGQPRGQHAPAACTLTCLRLPCALGQAEASSIPSGALIGSLVASAAATRMQLKRRGRQLSAPLAEHSHARAEGHASIIRRARGCMFTAWRVLSEPSTCLERLEPSRA